jgi:hypothetical protein
MASMLGEVRHYIQDGNGNFPSGGIYWYVHNTRVMSRINTDHVLLWQVG